MSEVERCIGAASQKKIAENCARLGLHSIKPSVVDFQKPVPKSMNIPYDRILVDAPCSGLGTLRSHPEIKWQRRDKDIQRLGRLQKELVARAARLLKPGGILVYSTCTLTREENEAVVEHFLANHREFVLDDAGEYLPRQAKALVRGRYFLALPQRHNTDGFFAARMRKAQ